VVGAQRRFTGVLDTWRRCYLEIIIHFDPHTTGRVCLHSTWCRTSRSVNLIGPNSARSFLTVAKFARLNQFERTEPGRWNNKSTAMLQQSNNRYDDPLTMQWGLCSCRALLAATIPSSPRRSAACTCQGQEAQNPRPKASRRLSQQWSCRGLGRGATLLPGPTCHIRH
jgi:hypothetical protein